MRYLLTASFIAAVVAVGGIWLMAPGDVELRWVSLKVFGLIELLLIFVVMCAGRRKPGGAATAKPRRSLINMLTRVVLVVLSVPCFVEFSMQACSLAGMLSGGMPPEGGLRRILIFYTVAYIAPLVFWASAAVLLVRGAIIVGRPAPLVQATASGPTVEGSGGASDASPADGHEPAR